MEKTCLHEGCGETFTLKNSRDRSKYCEEHRQYKYLYKRYHKPMEYEKRDDDIIPNILFQVEIKRKCRICGADYTTNAYPSQKINTSYCEIHRNEYQRGLYLKNNEIYNGDQPETPNHVGEAKGIYYMKLQREIEEVDVFNTNDLDEMVERSIDFFPMNSISDNAVIRLIGKKGKIIKDIVDNGWAENINRSKFQSIIGN